VTHAGPDRPREDDLGLAPAEPCAALAATAVDETRHADLPKRRRCVHECLCADYHVHSQPWGWAEAAMIGCSASSFVPRARRMARSGWQLRSLQWLARGRERRDDRPLAQSRDTCAATAWLSSWPRIRASKITGGQSHARPTTRHTRRKELSHPCQGLLPVFHWWVEPRIATICEWY
jgi:hypothetical protein